MKPMSLTPHIEPDRLEEIARVLDEQVWPEYRELPDFVGLVELPADHVRRQVAGLSIWDGDLDASEDAIARFRKEITSVSGCGCCDEDIRRPATRIKSAKLTRLR